MGVRISFPPSISPLPQIETAGDNDDYAFIRNDWRDGIKPKTIDMIFPTVK